MMKPSSIRQCYAKLEEATIGDNVWTLRNKIHIKCFTRSWNEELDIVTIFYQGILGDGDGDEGCGSWLLESWTCPAKCKFQRISSTEGLSPGLSWRHLRHISIVVFSDSSEHPLCIAGSAMLFRAISSVFRLTCNWE